jgi:predicted dehydrogenase
MGRTHIEALRRLGNVDVAVVVGRRAEAAAELAGAFGVGRWVTDIEGVVGDRSIDAVHVCTPNASHYPIASASLEAGKHVLCEKPLAMSSAEGAALVALAEEHGVRHATCHNLRYYPMVQQMRRMREAGELGDVLIVQGTYSQDWLLYDTDWNWRIESGENGPSRCMADIGSHFCDMAEHVTGERISSVVADLQTFHATRRKPGGPVETFGGPGGRAEATEVPITTEDFGAVTFRMGSRVRGAYTASQVSAGRKNGLAIEVYGTKAGVCWNQERPDELWIGRRDRENSIFLRDPALMNEAARSYSDYPQGHAEGYPDTFKQTFRRFYHAIEHPGTAPEYPTFADGLRQLRILEAELESDRLRAWVDVDESR